jgi:predicted Zn-dependent protease with MMP-like domain
LYGVRALGPGPLIARFVTSSQIRELSSPADDQTAVDLLGHRTAGRAEHDPRLAAAGAVNRQDRLARYRLARERVSPRHSLQTFEELVAEALDDLPPYVQQRLENVAVVVEPDVDPEYLRKMGYDEGLLGLYEGINRVDRASGYHLVAPDRITLYWRPIIDEVGSGDREAIRQEIRATVIHEVAHHFGIDDAELERLEGHR